MILSICMMVKNEAKNLRKCLESLEPIMKEIKSELIIVDTGSEDNTVEIAKEYTNKVYFHEWNNNFSHMRNITISYAKGAWIFIIDADEVVEDPQGLVKFLKSNKANHYNTGTIVINSYTRENDDLTFGSLLIPRLFKNDEEFKYEGAIHEQPKFKSPIINIDIQIAHYGYVSTDKELMERKFHRNIEILKSEIEKDPENFYYWYQLSLSYGMHKDYKEALEANIKAYDIVNNTKIDVTRCMYIYTHLAITYFLSEMYEEAVEISNEAIKIRDEYLDLHYVLGKSQMELGRTEEAINSFKSYLRMHKNYYKFHGSKDITTANYTLGFIEEVYLNLGILYKQLEQYDKAIDYINKIKSRKVLNMAIETVVDLFIKADKFKQLKRYYDSKILGQNQELLNHFTLHLEKYRQQLDKIKQNQIISIFAGYDNGYSVLNEVRLEEVSNTKMNPKILDHIEKLDLNSLPEFYGDIIYYLIKRQTNIKDVFPNLREITIISHLQYLSSKEDIILTLLNYMEKQETTDDVDLLRINKTLYKYILIQNELNLDNYRDVFLRYIESGTRYLTKIYSPAIFENKMIYDVKNDEEAFLLYLCLAEKTKHKDIKEYIRYLRKGLKICPVMKKGIELLASKAKEITEAKSTDINKKKKLDKKMFEDLITMGRIEDALNLIHNYESTGQKDIETYSMKAVIAMMENRLEDAENILQCGLEIEPSNFDLTYNLAYLYQLKEQYDNSIKYYKKALMITDNKKDQEEIVNALRLLFDELKSEPTVPNNIISGNTEDIHEELDMYSNRLKKDISSLIESGDLNKAISLIAQYETIILDDPDIYSMKAIIAMMEENFSYAEKIINNGLKLDENHFDLLYNFGYLYQIQGKVQSSIEYYRRALINTKNQDEKDEIYNALNILEAEENRLEVMEDIIPGTSIIILTYNNLEYSKLCIESIRKYTKRGSCEIIVVDNNSTDNTVKWLKQQNDIKLILNKENLGFPKGCNQGIEIAEKDNDILLLNNDVVVTQNWIDNLKRCLYSNNKIGAVGSITNSCSNYQAIPVQYNNLDEMIGFAKQNNISSSSKWEERLRLVGFCMLIKNSVVKEVGFLDERFSPGNFEDDDYSFRVRKAGYRLMLCKDSFIHHFGSASFGKETSKYNNLLINNRRKFKEKWGFDPYHIIDIRKDITELIVQDNTQEPKILQVGCSGGGTLLDIKNAIPSSHLYGIESEKKVLANSDNFANIITGDINSINKFAKESFDYIIITKNYNDLAILQQDLKKVCPHLAQNGSILITLPKDLNTKDENFKNTIKSVLDDITINSYSSYKDKLLHVKVNFKNKIEGMPLVSILIPAYNRPHYLKQALDSALNQTYNNIEIVICDDSTNDKVESIMNAYLEKHSNIRYYRNKRNLGQFENDLKLFELAKGEYINYLMDDDVFEPEKIERMMDYYINDVSEEIKLVTSHRQLIDENGNKLPNEGIAKKLFKEDKIMDGKELGNFMLINNFNLIGEPTTVLFRKKDLTEPFGTFNGRKYGCNVDQASWLNLLSKGKVVYIADTLSYFRVHSNQQLQSDKMKCLGAIDYVHEVLESPKLGFFQTEEEYEQAVNKSFEYAEYIINTTDKSSIEEEQLNELMEYYNKLKIINSKYNSIKASGQFIYSQNEDNKALKFLLRRIENNLYYEESLKQLKSLIKNNQITKEQLMYTINKYVADKEEILNISALCYYEEQKINEALNILNIAYKIDPNYSDTIFNIAYIAYSLGDIETAITYLNNVKNKDEEMKLLEHKIMGEL